MIGGAITAIVTPFRDGRVDEEALKELVEFQVRNGIQGIVPCGTTGESPTLSHDEHRRVIELCIEAAAGRVPIIAGTGSNSTAEAVALTRHAHEAGAAAALIVSPYYNKPTQEGLYRHFRTIAENVPIPILLYNIAGRTAVNIEPDTMARLAAECPNIIGVKEASGSLDQMQRIKRWCREDFLLISGDDALTLPLYSIGGKGVVSVAANLIPSEIVSLCAECAAGRWEDARDRHYRILPLIKALFIETNPIPVKTAMGLMGFCRDELRLPLCPLSSGHREVLREILTSHGLLPESSREDGCAGPKGGCLVPEEGA